MRVNCATCGRLVEVKVVSYGDGHVAVCPECGGIAHSGITKPTGKCDSDMPCTHRKDNDCLFDGKCGGQVEDNGLTKITVADLEENTTGGRWK